MRTLGVKTVIDSIQRTASGAEDTQGKYKQDDARSRWTTFLTGHAALISA